MHRIDVIDSTPSVALHWQNQTFSSPQGLPTGIQIQPQHLVIDRSISSLIEIEVRDSGKLTLTLEPQVQAQVVVRFSGSLPTITEFDIRLAPHSHLKWASLQNEAQLVTRQDTCRAELTDHAQFTGSWMVQGPTQTQRTIQLMFKGSGSHATLNGLALLSGSSKVSTQTQLHHTQPQTEAKQYFKSILGDRSVSEFTGLVKVDDLAQKTDSNQYNHSLLLSDQARVLSRPQLEIFADDVKCSHGATVGQLDADQIFYLMSRGLSKPEAQSMLLYGFAEDVIEKMDIPLIENELQTQLPHHLASFQLA